MSFDLQSIRLFVLDMDGTFYLGERILPGSLGFLQRLKECGRKFMFFTNNSSKSPAEYVEKLKRMGCLIDRNQIMTSGDVTAAYLNTHYPGKSVYLLGTPALEKNFEENHIRLTEEQPDIVVVGFDTTLTYEKLMKACRYIRRGSLFLATHPDINCPTEDDSIPDCGSVCAAITLSTGVEPRYLGKPYPETLEMVLRASGCAREEIGFVGDRLYTDVACGVKNGASGILVLTGETKREEVETSAVKPDAVFASLKELGEALV